MPQTYRMVFTLLSGFFIFLAGCEKAFKSPEDDRVVADINGFGLTVADFKEDADPALLRKYPSLSPRKQKEEILNELIMKEILLQEAQRMNLDKEGAFMKEIEGYWEQALMKALIQKKLEEFSGHFSFSEVEILEAYGRMQRLLTAEMIFFDERPDAERLSKAGADFDAVKRSLQERIVMDVPPTAYTFGDIPQKLEGVLYTLRVGEVSLPLEYNGNWVVIRLSREEPQVVEPLQELKPRLAQELVRRKREIVLEDWAVGLKKKSSVRVDKELLDKVELE